MIDPRLAKAAQASGAAMGALSGAAFAGNPNLAAAVGQTVGAASATGVQAAAAPAAPVLRDVDAVESPIAPSVMPDVAQAATGPLQQAFHTELDSQFGPSHMYLWDQVAKNGSAMQDRNTIFGLAQNGFTPGDYFKQREVEHFQGVAQNVAARTGDMGDSDFEQLYGQLKSQLTPPAPTPDPTLRGPNTAQLIAGGLAALLAPRFAPIALAAPFQSQLQQHAIDLEKNKTANADSYRRWQGQVEGTKDALSILERHDAAREGVQARRDNSRNVLLGRLTTADTPTELRAAFAALDAGGYGDTVPKDQRDALVAESQKRTDDTGKAKKIAGDETLIQRYLVAADDQNELPAMRAQHARNARALIAANNASDPRLAQIDAILPKLAAPSQKQVDDHDKAVAGVAQTNANTVNTQARTETENLTRQGRVNLLIQQGNLAQANIEARRANTELDAIRKKYLPAELQGKINKDNADADRARRVATDTLGGMSSRSQSSADAWSRLGLKLQDAEGKTRAALAGIQPQKEAIQSRIDQIDQALTSAAQNGGMNDVQKNALAKEKGQLGLALGKLGAVYADKSSYLETVKQQRAAVDAKTQEATTRATTPPTQGGNAPVLGFTPYDAHERAYLADVQSRIASGKYDAATLKRIAAQDIAQYRKQKGYK